jgi:hypothetical protein
VQKINDVNTIQVIIEFTHDLTGTDRNWNAKDYNLRILNYGKLSIGYDLEDAFLVPGTYSLVIGDPDGVLDDLFFGAGEIPIATDKQAKITLKINGSNKFLGHAIEDSIDYNDATCICDLVFAPKTDLINKRMVYDEDGLPLNPFGYTQDTVVSILDILLDIYKLVNPSLTYPTGLQIIQDWEFQGRRNPTTICYLNNITFVNLMQSVNELFFVNTYGILTCGDVLKKLAIDWCCFTGLISDEKAFFRKLFLYDPANVQSVNVLSRKKGYKYGLIDYVKVTTELGDPDEPYKEGVFTELEDRYIIRKTLPGFYVTGAFEQTNIFAAIDRDNHFVFFHGLLANQPSEGAIYSNNGSNFKVVGTAWAGEDIYYITTERVAGENDPQESGTLTKVSGDGDATYTYASYGDADAIPPSYSYEIYQARDPNLFSNAFKNHGALCANFWYKYRGNIQNCRVDKFIFRGVDYDYLKDFNYGGSKYQPISMVFDFANSSTECEAIYIGELA